MVLVRFSVQVQCDRIVDYFVKLVQSFPRAVWVQNTQIAAKKGIGIVNKLIIILDDFYAYISLCTPDGLVVEQFCYKVGIILSNLVPFCSPDQQQKVRSLIILFYYRYTV